MKSMSEYIPAWIDGVLTPVEKLEVHQRGLRHKAVSVFVMDGDNVLLQRRALGKYHTPGLWANTCCTHPMSSKLSAATHAAMTAKHSGPFLNTILPTIADSFLIISLRRGSGTSANNHTIARTCNMPNICSRSAGINCIKHVMSIMSNRVET